MYKRQAVTLCELCRILNDGQGPKLSLIHIYFAKYAFNKSHAAAYAFVSYQTAWLKYYYPVEFMAALMTSCIDNPGKVAEYILSSRQMGISILPPDKMCIRDRYDLYDKK